jgi:hypothetical protein
MKMGSAHHRQARSLPAVGAVLAVTLVALLAAGAASARPTAPAAGWRTCGADNHRDAGWYDVIERGSSCHQARRLARRWWHANPTWGFACVIVDRRHGSGRVLCRRDRDGTLERVRFSYSAPA